MSEFLDTEIGPVPADWTYPKFGDVLTEGTRNGIYKSKQHHGKGVKIINMGELFAFDRIGCQEMQRLELTEQEKTRFLVQDGDLLFARRSLVAEGAGKCSLVVSPCEATTFESSIIRARPNNLLVDSRYLAYLFSSRVGRYLMDTILRQVAVSGITGTDLIELRLPLPSRGEQEEVANILSSLDEKIELNRKQNRTLEAIAQALFKRWFVEFEFPDENGRPYQSSGGAMQPSELGEIPVGWRTGKLEELIGELETGSRPKGGVGMFTDGIPSIGAESITRIGEYDYGKTKYVPEEYFTKMRRGIIKDRDVLIYKDGGTPGRFDVRISMFGGGFPFKAACINEHVFRVQAKKPVYQNYLYLWFSSYPVLEELRHRGAKAAIPGINSNDVKELDFLFMDEVVLDKFDEVIKPLFAKLLRNSREMAALARLRDALLPKLMSGELRVA